MRGSVYYQTGQLAKQIYAPGMKKGEQKETDMLANNKTIETYREVWNQVGNYAKEELGIKNMQNLKSEHINSYLESKLVNGAKEQTVQVTNVAIGKLEVALSKLDPSREYDFSSRLEVIKEARSEGLLQNPAKSESYTRAYADPKAIIENMKSPEHQLAAKIQVQGGARLEGIEKIVESRQIDGYKLTNNHLSGKLEGVKDLGQGRVQVPQLQGIHKDPITGREHGKIFTIEKGGKPGLVNVSKEVYNQLQSKISTGKGFSINRESYRNDLKAASAKAEQIYQGTHGLRWNYAQDRFKELQEKGNFSRDEALQTVSWEMKHERADITEHYLR